MKSLVWHWNKINTWKVKWGTNIDRTSIHFSIYHYIVLKYFLKVNYSQIRVDYVIKLSWKFRKMWHKTIIVNQIPPWKYIWQIDPKLQLLIGVVVWKAGSGQLHFIDTLVWGNVTLSNRHQLTSSRFDLDNENCCDTIML